MMYDKVKHLEMIQAIITRMASNSFMLKGWAVTVVAATFVLSSKDSIAWFVVVAAIPVIMFWLLDSFYFNREKRYRVLYKRTAMSNEPDLTYSLDIPDSSKAEKTCFLQAMFNITEWVFYVCLILSIIVTGLILI